jgi:serine/threonine-protein kinase
MGTATYISPEQAKGLPVDARSDLYSLGAVLYEMLAGRPPFVGESSVAVAYKQVNEVPQPPSAHNAEVPPALDAVVMRALAKNPANRYQDAAAFCADLIRARNGEEVEATPLMPLVGDATQVIARPRSTQILPPVVDPPGSGRKVWLGILIGLLAIAVIAGAAALLAGSLLGGGPSTSPGLKPIPKLIGLTEAEARTRLKSAGFTARPSIKEEVSTSPAGTVIRTDPAAGTATSTDAVITLVIAKAPPQVTVPSLTGLTVAEATTQLTTAKLKLGTQAHEPSTLPVDTVIRQDPLADAQVPKNTLVNVVLSSGPPTPTTVPIPDVICRSVTSATNQLEHARFTVVNGGAASSFNPSCKPGSNWVAAQSPTGSAPSGSTVTIYTNPDESPSPSDSPSP